MLLIFDMMDNEYNGGFFKVGTVIRRALFILLMCCTGLNAHADTTKNVVLMLKAKNNAFYDAILLGANERAAKYHINIATHYGSNEDDWQSQVQFIQDSIEQYDGFILIPNRSDKFGPILGELVHKNKPVVIVDTPITNGSDTVLTMVSSDNLIGGSLAGLYITKQLKGIKGNCVILLSGNTKAQTHQDRNLGFIRVMNERRPDLKIRTLEADSNYALAMELVVKRPNIFHGCAAIFAGSDTMILGALEGFEKLKMRAPPILVGYDAILEAQRDILKGRINASVQQIPEEMGRVAMQALNDYFVQKPVEKSLIITPHLLVRRSQLDTISEKDLK